MARRIFMSYRRDDSAGHAGRLYDRLVARFGVDDVFLDLGAIRGGTDFVRAIENAIQGCEVLIAVIGPRWLQPQPDGRRRIDNPGDLVRFEIRTALERRIAVVPVLLEGALMPPPADLPDDIAALSRQNAVRISDDRFDYDAARLVDVVQDRLGVVAAARHDEVAGEAEAVDEAPPEVASLRKTVTALVAERATAAPASADPEAVASAVHDVDEVVMAAASRFGGRPQVLPGGAVVVMFGVPDLHEDDAERAVRAAVEMVAAAPDGSLRIALATGEVLATGRGDVAGPPLDAAWRLVRDAAPGEVLLDEATVRMTRGVVVAEPRGPASVLVEVVDRTASPMAEAPLVARDRELLVLEQLYQGVVEDRGIHLVTILGPAGIGKSRLLREFLGQRDDATVLVGRCLPYGDGITFWPIAEMVRHAAEMDEGASAGDAVARIEALVAGMADGPAIASLVAQAMGLAPASSTTDEVFWGIRKLFEHLARTRPLVAVVEDLHWAEPTLLELLEHLAEWILDAPVLLVCVAREELLDVHPTWGGGKRHATTISLRPLPEKQVERLVRELVGERDVAPELVERIISAAGGNPLFAEEMVAMLADEGSSGAADVRLPPTIAAVLAARLDRLGELERDVALRASVVGQEFYREAVTDMSPQPMRPQVPAQLMALARRALVGPADSTFAGEEAYRFRHLLIRDAAYAALPKALRGTLHRRFAHWLDERTRGRAGEYDEIVGFHLEQAARYARELGDVSEAARAVAPEAAARLAAAGRHALALGDMPAAATLLGRAAELLEPGDADRLEILPRLGEARMELGDFDGARGSFDTLVREAEAAGSEAAVMRGRLGKAAVLAQVEPETAAREGEPLARAAVAVFDRVGDDHGLTKAWGLLVELHSLRGRYALAEEAARRAVEHAERAGDPREVARNLGILGVVSVFGPTPVDKALDRCDHLLRRARGHPLLEAHILLAKATLTAMRGSPDDAHELLGRSRGIFRDIGWKLSAAASAQHAGTIEMLAGDPAAAEAELRAGYEQLEAMGEKGYLATTAAQLAQAVYAQGRLEEADAYVEVARSLASAEDVSAQAGWRSVAAKLAARRGDLGESRALAGEAVALTEGADDLNARGQALADLAEVLRAADAAAEADDALGRAVRAWEAKGNAAAVRLVQAESSSRGLDRPDPPHVA